MIIVREIVSLALAASVDDQHYKRRVSSGRRRTGDVVIAKPQNLPETEGHGDRKAEEGEGRRSGTHPLVFEIQLLYAFLSCRHFK